MTAFDWSCKPSCQDKGGCDGDFLLLQVEEDYGFGGQEEVAAEEEADLQPAADPQPAAPTIGGATAPDLSWLENPLEGAEGDWGF